jgi:hypothetical protein
LGKFLLAAEHQLESSPITEFIYLAFDVRASLMAKIPIENPRFDISRAIVDLKWVHWLSG